jgi:GNAT superfamily N-acetyltransferase
MSAINVRVAAATDLPRLAELWQEKRVLLNQSDPRFALSPGGQAQWASAAAEWLADARCAVLVAEHEGQVLGYVVGWLESGMPAITERVGAVSEIAIDAHSYRGGLGRALVQALRTWFQERGVEHMVVSPTYAGAGFLAGVGASPWLDVCG